MKYSVTKYLRQPEILKRKLAGSLFVPVTVADDSFTDGVCKAGTALTSAGELATEVEADEDEGTAASSDASGILLNDVYEENPNGSLIKAFAVVNSANIEANTGEAVTDGVKNTLTNIVFE